MKPVVVHGGGPEISRQMKRLGLQPRFVAGHRVTDSETMEIAKMVLVGKVNKDIVGLISRHGGTAVGISGEDGHLLRVRPKQHVDEAGNEVDLGFVGEVTEVNTDVLNLLAVANIPSSPASAPTRPAPRTTSTPIRSQARSPRRFMPRRSSS